MSDVIEGIAHAFDQQLILIEHAIEQLREVVQLIVRLALGHTSIQVSRINNRLRRGYDLTDRFHGPMSKQSSPDKSEHNDRRHHCHKNFTEWLEQCLSFVGAAPDLQDRAIGQTRRHQREIFFFILGNADKSPLNLPWADLQAPAVECDPIFGNTEKDVGIEWPRQADKK